MTTQLLVPKGAGPFGAVILFVDAGGLRASQTAIGERIAGMGYLVAIPDLFFRTGSPFDLLPPGAPRDASGFALIFGDPAKRETFFKKYYATAMSYENLSEDVEAVLAMLEKRSNFNGKVGTTGYCMGGNASLRAATLFGPRLAAAASFHGGGLVTDQPDSPHLRVKSIKAEIYVAGATADAGFNDAAKATLIEALANASVTAVVETYQARHGFVVEDHDTYDAAAARRHDLALEGLFRRTLRM